MFKVQRDFLLLAVLLLSLTLSAQTKQGNQPSAITHHPTPITPEQAYGSYYAYPGPEGTTLTPAPKGYVPFYISHYGRHGSRYMCGSGDYKRPLAAFDKAAAEGKLTLFGQNVYSKVKRLCAAADHRNGELTALGARQHRGIAERMVKNFPEVFAGETNIEARSTVVIRCILSMENALQQMIAMNPKLKVFHDASWADMRFMNFMESYDRDKRLDSLIHNPEYKTAMKRYGEKYMRPGRLMAKLFTDTTWVRENLKPDQIYFDLFHMASDVQDVDEQSGLQLLDIFTSEELYDAFQYLNIGWYLEFGASPMNHSLAPYGQRRLLENIIVKADSCLKLDHPGVTLRYGHDTMVTPLACLLGVNGWDMVVDDPETLPERGWRLYRLTPMATNLQFIFYRNPQRPEDILFKLLYCEKEATLPLKAVTGPYYRWADFKAYYTKKLAAYQY